MSNKRMVMMLKTCSGVIHGWVIDRVCFGEEKLARIRVREKYDNYVRRGLKRAESRN